MGGNKGSNEIKETSYEKAAADVANQQWSIYQNELSQYENSFIERVGNYNSDSNMSDTKSDADLAYNSAYSQNRDNTALSLAASGVDPSSGKFKQTQADITTDQAVSQANTVNRAQSSEQDKYVAGLSDVVAMGTGQKATALQGLSDVATMSANQAASDAQSSFNTRSANTQAVGAVAGAGLRSYQNYQKQNTAKMDGVDGMTTQRAGLNTYNVQSNPSGYMYS
ncbi:hypothetical protein SBX64_16100 [Vibrio rhizosphaerae]|uniref:Uncharacterized protein n=1 Tax=Vibrio rhizosphaerae TaxID=398736 RepID=A0ABU4IY65_9VIBR|nr:hypothetical protein [Vibrio rhizosphaerae]MDW6094062.1 hypothetical protein [Vibrio rhizosphaerae]